MAKTAPPILHGPVFRYLLCERSALFGLPSGADDFSLLWRQYLRVKASIAERANLARPLLDLWVDRQFQKSKRDIELAYLNRLSVDDEFLKKEIQTRRNAQTGRRSKVVRTATTVFDWRKELGLPASERRFAVAKASWKRKAQTAHPDRGGSHEVMARLNLALRMAMVELA